MVRGWQVHTKRYYWYHFTGNDNPWLGVGELILKGISDTISLARLILSQGLVGSYQKVLWVPFHWQGQSMVRGWQALPKGTFGSISPARIIRGLVFLGSYQKVLLAAFHWQGQSMFKGEQEGSRLLEGLHTLRVGSKPCLPILDKGLKWLPVTNALAYITIYYSTPIRVGSKLCPQM